MADPQVTNLSEAGKMEATYDETICNKNEPKKLTMTMTNEL
jgi:hypothetical protein